MPMKIELAPKISRTVADQVVHRLHVELGREALLDAVDDRQLGRALVRLGEEPLRLVEQPGVLEGHAQARGDRRHEPLVRLAEGVRVEALERDDPDHALTGRDRYAEPGLASATPVID